MHFGKLEITLPVTPFQLRPYSGSEMYTKKISHRTRYVVCCVGINRPTQRSYIELFIYLFPEFRMQQNNSKNQVRLRYTVIYFRLFSVVTKLKKKYISLIYARNSSYLSLLVIGVCHSQTSFLRRPNYLLQSDSNSFVFILRLRFCAIRHAGFSVKNRRTFRREERQHVATRKVNDK